MPYIGSVPTSSFTSLAKQDITGNGGTNYTLNHPVTNANDVAVFVNNVRQEPTEAYTASDTTLSMTGAINSSDSFYILFLGQAIQTSNPPDGSVSTAKIADDAVNLTSKVTGVLPVANGGTGVSIASPYIMLDKDGNQTITSGSRTVVTGWTVTSGNSQGLSLASNSVTVDATTAGKYFCNWQCSVNSNGNNIGDLRLSILQEGTRKIGAYNLLLAGSVGADPFDAAWFTANVSGILNLAADDTVTVDVLCVGGGTVIVSGGDSESPLSTNFSMFRIGV